MLPSELRNIRLRVIIIWEIAIPNKHHDDIIREHCSVILETTVKLQLNLNLTRLEVVLFWYNNNIKILKSHE